MVSRGREPDVRGCRLRRASGGEVARPALAREPVPAPQPAQTQAPPPESPQISAAIRSCSAGEAFWGRPWPP